MTAIIIAWVFHFIMIFLSFMAINTAKYQMEFIDSTYLSIPTIYLLKIEYLFYGLPLVTTLIIGIFLILNRKKKSVEEFNSQKIDYSISVITLSLLMFIFAVIASVLPFISMIMYV